MEYDSYGNPKDIVWPEPNEDEFKDGYKLPIDDKGHFNPKIYEAMAKWCNNKQMRIEMHPKEYWQIVAIPEEEIKRGKINYVKSIRGQYMSEILNKTERYETQKAAGIDTTDSEETYKNYLLYLQYLRDIPQNKDFPNIEVLTFEKWSDKLNEKVNTSEES